MSNLRVYQYENNPIVFNLGENIMINATQMAKPFPTKRINDFVNNRQTKEFVALLEGRTENPVLVVQNGGTGNGTWMHRKLALKFAAWLSPEFELWVYDRIESILTTSENKRGMSIDSFNMELMDYVNQATERHDLMQNQIRLLIKEIGSLRVSVENNVQPKTHPIALLESHKETLITATTVAELLEYPGGVIALNKALKAAGVQYKKNGTKLWKLSSQYEDKGYAKMVIKENISQEKGYASLMWYSKKGVEFIKNILNGGKIDSEPMQNKPVHKPNFTYLLKDIAKEIGLSLPKLHAFLSVNGYIIKGKGQKFSVQATEKLTRLDYATDMAYENCRVPYVVFSEPGKNFVVSILRKYGVNKINKQKLKDMNKCSVVI
jgi:phage antirepressor YoqD-like protein